MEFSYVCFGAEYFTYTPDFKLIEENKYIEVKGYFTEESKTKVKAAQTGGYEVEVWDATKLQELGILDASLRVLT